MKVWILTSYNHERMKYLYLPKNHIFKYISILWLLIKAKLETEETRKMLIGVT